MNFKKMYAASKRYNLLKLFLLFIIIIVILKITSETNNKTNLSMSPNFQLGDNNLSREEILEETSKFVSRGVDEDDPELIEFVKSLIIPPSTKQYNFERQNQPNGDYSQHHQSTYIDEILKQKTDGFYIGMKYFYKILIDIYYILKKI